MLVEDTCEANAGHVTVQSGQRSTEHWAARDILQAYTEECSSSAVSRSKVVADGPHLIPFRFCYALVTVAAAIVLSQTSQVLW